MNPNDPRVEMFQRGHSKETFFNMKALAPRPMSSATEFDTDFEDDDSEIEDNSPRLSMNSVSARHRGFYSLLINHRLVDEARQPYPPSRKYIHQAWTPKISMASGLIWLRRSRLRGQEDRICSGLPQSQNECMMRNTTWRCHP